jgi:hypothetical protein
MLALVACLLAAALPTAARAGDNPHARIKDLEHQLFVAKIRLDAWAKRAEGLYRLTEDLLVELVDARAAKPAIDEVMEAEAKALRLSMENAEKRHEAEMGSLRDALKKERARHAAEEETLRGMLAAQKAIHQKALDECRSSQRDAEARHAEALRGMKAEIDAEREHHRDHVRRLDKQLRDARRFRDRARKSEMATKRQLAAVQDTAEWLRRDLERLQWHQHLTAPHGSVQKALGYVSIAHWHRELAEGDTARQRVALQVLAFLPDRSEKTVELIMAVAEKNDLLDTVTGAVKTIGKPAVAPLMGLGRARKAPLGWVLWTLGEMRGNARDALPWLREIVGDETYGREDRDQARRAIKRIVG